jgi:hypothetical protein
MVRASARANFQCFIVVLPVTVRFRECSPTFPPRLGGLDHGVAQIGIHFLLVERPAEIQIEIPVVRVVAGLLACDVERLQLEPGVQDRLPHVQLKLVELALMPRQLRLVPGHRGAPNALSGDHSVTFPAVTLGRRVRCFAAGLQSLARRLHA